jgi:hypothetical protein
VEDANRKNIARAEIRRGCNVDFIGNPGVGMFLPIRTRSTG